MRWSPSDTENFARRALGLRPVAPLFFDSTPEASTGCVRLDILSDDEEVRRERSRHDHPRRARLSYAAGEAHRRALGVPALVRSGRDRIDARRGERALARSRHLVFDSPHVHTYGLSVSVEGVLRAAECAHGIWVEVLAQGAGADDWSVSAAWQRGEIARPHQWGASAVVVPAAGLTPEIVHDALLRFYMQRYRFRPGHWAIRERTLPALDTTTHVEWEWPSEQRALTRAEHAVVAAERAVAFAQQDTDGVLPRLYGRRRDH